MKSRLIFEAIFLTIKYCQVYRIHSEHAVSEMSEILQENFGNLIRGKGGIRIKDSVQKLFRESVEEQQEVCVR